MLVWVIKDVKELAKAEAKDHACLGSLYSDKYICESI